MVAVLSSSRKRVTTEEQGLEVKTAIEKVFSKPEEPMKDQSDKGEKLFSALVKKFLKSHHVKLYLQKIPIECAIRGRFI